MTFVARGYRALSALWISLLLASLQLTEASIYPIRSRLWIPPFEHAEKMFATDLGPVLSRKGPSTITVNVTGENITEDMNGWRMVVLFFYVESFETFQAVQDRIKLFACAKHVDPLTGLKGVFNAERSVHVVKNESVHAFTTYDVDMGGWISTQIFICSDKNGAAEVMPFTGTMEVRNPFGLLPAVLYGMFPFSGALTIGYTLLDVFFTTLLIIHRKQRLHLHLGILMVLMMGIASSATWFYAFYQSNKSGDPVYPYPKPFVAAVILDTLMRTFARTLLVVVCLGYGIVRNALTRCEVASIVLLSVAYLVSGIGDEVTRGTSAGAEFREKPTAWSFVQLFCNLFYIMWIHFALDRILKQLHDTKQSAKLGMYKALAWSLAAFIIFFTVLTLIAVCSRVGVFDWPVELEWMQLVAWPVLNFIVSAAMCLIWRPTANSSQFAFSMQLSTSEETDASDLEMTESAMSRDSDDDDEFFNRDLTIDEQDDQVEIDLSPAVEKKDKQVDPSTTLAAGG